MSTKKQPPRRVMRLAPKSPPRFTGNEEHMERGDLIKDKVSGMKGIVIAETWWLQGCRRLTIQPQGMYKDRPYDAHSYDEGQCEMVKKKVVKFVGPSIVEIPEHIADEIRVAAAHESRKGGKKGKKPTGGPRPELSAY